MDPHAIATAAKVGNVVEALLAALRPGRDGPTAKTLRVIPYRSIGDRLRLTVRGRVVREARTNHRPLGRMGAISSREHLAALYRAFDAVEVPFAQIEASLDGVCSRTTCDAGGYFTVDLPAPRGVPWAPGRHDVRVQLIDLGPSAASPDGATPLEQSVPVEVFVAGELASLAIVSDLDDTAMDTNTPRSWAAIRTVMFRSARRRKAVPGVAELYQRLRDGASGCAGNPIHYISSGAWNLYDLVLDYLQTHALPDGPLLLNDWGSPARTFHAVGHAHKAAHVTALLGRLPRLPFLLIGDDVQEDPEIYAQVAIAHAGRVAAIWIRAVRDTRERRGSIEALRPSLLAAGTRLVIASETTDFVNDAARRGWLPQESPEADGPRSVGR